MGVFFGLLGLALSFLSFATAYGSWTFADTFSRASDQEAQALYRTLAVVSIVVSIWAASTSWRQFMV